MNSRVISQVVLGVIFLAIFGAVVAGLVWGLPTFLIGLAAGALSLVIVLMWASLQQMEEDGEMDFEQALSYAAPSAEEEQKRALLRTLKDLEYELSVGKISREDYDQVSAEIREKAKRMIALTDETMKEKLKAAEARVLQHLEEKKSGTSKEAAKEPKKKSKKDQAQAQPSEEAGEETKSDVAKADEETKSDATNTNSDGSESDELAEESGDAADTKSDGSESDEPAEEEARS